MTCSAEDRLGSIMPTMAVNGDKLHYKAYGHGPAILGIHGTPSSTLA